MTESMIPENWPIWAALVYLIVKDLLPVMAKTLTAVTGIIVPANASTKKLLLEQQNKTAERQSEIEEQRLDLREREVIALEQIGKTLVMLDTRLQLIDKKTDLMATGLVTANQALAIVLDRVHRRREEYETKPTTPALGDD